MTQLCKFFKNSAKCLKIHIKTATECCDFKKLQKREKKRVIRTMKKAAQTRCLSLDTGMEALKNIRGLPNRYEPWQILLLMVCSRK